VFKRIDESSFLITTLERLSALLARQRGLPVIIGLVMVIIGAILQLTNIAVGSTVLEVVHVALQNLGIIVALIGLLLAEPLGK
jgi:hypothetical protein